MRRLALQQEQRLLEQVVEIQRVGRALLRLVLLLRLGDLLAELEEVRILLDEHLVDRAAGVDREAEDIGEHLALGKALVLRVDARAGDHGVEHVLLVLAVHDRKARREARAPPAWRRRRRLPTE